MCEFQLCAGREGHASTANDGMEGAEEGGELGFGGGGDVAGENGGVEGFQVS